MERAHTWADPVPPAAVARLGLMPSFEALRRIHQPGERIDAAGLRALAEGRSDAHRRLGFEELLAVSVAVERARRSAGPARAFAPAGDALSSVGARLAITPTPSQHEATATLLTELAATAPMRRLLVGDVGSGKTAVALAATLAVRAGGSVAWLCPTTLVAEQHARTLQTALAGEGGPVAVLLGTDPRAGESRPSGHRAGRSSAWWWAPTGCWSGRDPAGRRPRGDRRAAALRRRAAPRAGGGEKPEPAHVGDVGDAHPPLARAGALRRPRRGDDRGEARRTGQEVTEASSAPDDRAFVERTLERALEATGERGAARVFVVVPRIDAGDDEGDEDDGGDDALRHRHGADAWLAEALRPRGGDRARPHGRRRAARGHGGLPRGTHGSSWARRWWRWGSTCPRRTSWWCSARSASASRSSTSSAGAWGAAGSGRAACSCPSRRRERRARLDEVAACDDGFALAEMDLARRGAGEWFGARQSGVDDTLRFGDPLSDPRGAADARALAAQIVATDPDLAAHPALSRAVQRLLARGASPVAEDAG
jgi:ATP-dependent DNA helicase RecG